MAHTTKGTSKIIKSMEQVILYLTKELIAGSRTESTLGNGGTIRCMEKVGCNGLMVRFIKDNMRITRSMDWDHLVGPMEESM
jgi:hypothetical protein